MVKKKGKEEKEGEEEEEKKENFILPLLYCTVLYCILGPGSSDVYSLITA